MSSTISNANSLVNFVKDVTGSTNDAEIKKCITEEMKTMTQQQAELEKRVTELERWKWLVMGGSIVIGAILQFLVNAISK